MNTRFPQQNDAKTQDFGAEIIKFARETDQNCPLFDQVRSNLRVIPQVRPNLIQKWAGFVSLIYKFAPNQASRHQVRPNLMSKLNNFQLLYKFAPNQALDIKFGRTWCQNSSFSTFQLKFARTCTPKYKFGRTCSLMCPNFNRFAFPRLICSRTFVQTTSELNRNSYCCLFSPKQSKPQQWVYLTHFRFKHFWVSHMFAIKQTQTHNLKHFNCCPYYIWLTWNRWMLSAIWLLVYHLNMIVY